MPEALSWVMLPIMLAGAWLAWRSVRGKAGPTAPDALHAGFARRPVLGVLCSCGVLSAARAVGGPRLLAPRDGRDGLDLAPAPGLPPDQDAMAVVERFHARSSLVRGGVSRRAPAARWRAPPAPSRGDAARDLQTLGPPGSADASDPAGPGITRETLGRILWHTAGVREKRDGVMLRTAPSARALFATELYLVAGTVAGLDSGTWHYRADLHALERLTTGRPPPELLAQSVPAAIWATAVFERSGRKYGDRTYRYVLADLGHALENLRQACAASGIALRWLAAFDEDAAAQALGVDERREGVLAAALLGVADTAQLLSARPAQPGVAPGPAARASAGAGPEAADAAGLTLRMHRASSLTRTPHALASVEAAPASAPALASAPQDIVLPAARPLAMPLWQRIARRRSRRRYSTRPVALASLSTLLAALQPERVQLSPAVRLDVLTPAVQDLPSAVWRYDPGAHALRQRRRVESAALKAQARAAALDQDVIGGSSVVLVVSIARQAWAADPYGPARGYRQAFIESGMVGERAYLAATALGLGVCAVGAFFDDEAAALLGIDPAHEWPLHFVGLGSVDGPD